MANQEALDEARRWMRFAQEDLDASKALLSGLAATPRHACWLAQQATEKALKAVLIAYEIDWPSLRTVM